MGLFCPKKPKIKHVINESMIKIGNPYGIIDFSDNFWNDCKSLNSEIEKYKIINIKLLFNSGYENKKLIDEENIIGLIATYKNIFTGENEILKHQCSNNISYMKELVIKSNDYLKHFKICLNKDNNEISLISFITNMKKEISVGIKQKNEIIDNINEKNDILVGFFGYFNKKLNSIGGIYVSKIAFIKKILFGYFMLRHLLKNKKFKENWDKQYNKLSIEFQYIWKSVNLPDAIFSLVMKYCSI